MISPSGKTEAFPDMFGSVVPEATVLVRKGFLVRIPGCRARTNGGSSVQLWLVRAGGDKFKLGVLNQVVKQYDEFAHDSG